MPELHINANRNLLTIVTLAILCCGANRITQAEEKGIGPEELYLQAIATAPSSHELEERIRIARGIRYEAMPEYTGMHNASKSVNDDGSEDEDFRKISYSHLRAEIYTAYSGLFVSRVRLRVANETLSAYQLLADSQEQEYSVGKSELTKSVQARNEVEQARNEKMDEQAKCQFGEMKINVLLGTNINQQVPELIPQQIIESTYDEGALVTAYRSRRLSDVFLQMVGDIDSASVSPFSVGLEMQHSESLDTEAQVYAQMVKMRLRIAHEKALQYQNQIIPRNRILFKSRMDAYAQGAGSYEETLESYVVMLHSEMQLQEILGDQYMIVADVDRSTGIQPGHSGAEPQDMKPDDLDVKHDEQEMEPDKPTGDMNHVQ
jgi:hypothetical protein